jgi:hypothetical protein
MRRLAYNCPGAILVGRSQRCTAAGFLPSTKRLIGDGVHPLRV